MQDPDPDDPGDTLVITVDTGHTYTAADYDSGSSAWCTDCHENYMTVKGTVGNPTTGTYKAGDGLGNVTRYRHKMDVDIDTYTYSALATPTLPLEDANSEGDKLACVTCHRSHGTDATMSGKAAGVGPTAVTGGKTGSALLRMNNRGVCQDCHGK